MASRRKKTARRKPARKPARKKTGRKKTARRKPARKKTGRKTARRKPARKKTARRKPAPKKSPVRKATAPQKTAPAAAAVSRPAATQVAPAAPKPAARPIPERIGLVTHYFPHVNAGIVVIERGDVRVGDTLHFHGHTTDFYQRVQHMEVEHQTIEWARAGQTVGIQVSQRVREHDQVFKVSG